VGGRARGHGREKPSVLSEKWIVEIEISELAASGRKV
jgi:hypothetical protein